MPTWCIYVCKDVVSLWMGEHKSLHVQCFARYARVWVCKMSANITVDVRVHVWDGAAWMSHRELGLGYAAV